MLRILSAVMFVVVGIPAAATQGQGQSTMATRSSGLPEDVTTTIGELLAVAQKDFEPQPGKSWPNTVAHLTKAHAEFLVLLQKLGRQVGDGMAVKAGFERNLVEMARNYGQHPEHYGMLVKWYMEPPNPLGMHVITPMSPRRQHAVEKYRPTWELLLLAPCTKDTRFMRKTCFKAIRTIRSDASIPLLEYLFERARSKKQFEAGRGAAYDEQRRLLSALGQYCNATALYAILRCVAISEASPPFPKRYSVTMRKKAMYCLNPDPNNPAYVNRWTEVIEEVLEKDGRLSESDRSFLKEALSKPAQK